MQRDGCRLEGLWQEQSAHWVTRIEGPARWRTWNALPGSESDAPVAHGWLEYTEELLVFDYDGAGGGGYAYDWGFEEGCSVLRLDLARVGTGPPGYQLRYRLRRLAR